MTEQEKELMKNFKVEELEERLEMKRYYLWQSPPNPIGSSDGPYL